jgi:hypothetical protein
LEENDDVQCLGCNKEEDEEIDFPNIATVTTTKITNPANNQTRRSFVIKSSREDRG